MKEIQHIGVMVYLGSCVISIIGHILFINNSKSDLIATSSDTPSCALLILRLLPSAEQILTDVAVQGEIMLHILNRDIRKIFWHFKYKKLKVIYSYTFVFRITILSEEFFIPKIFILF
jgi:hypothetical protein